MRVALAWLIIGISSLFSQTIEEKIESYQSKEKKEESELSSRLQSLNEELPCLRKELKARFKLADEFYKKGAEENQFHDLLSEINRLKNKISELEGEWRELSTGQAKKEDEGYGLWDQEETTISGLIMEYGSSDYLYIVPPEVSQMKINLHSGIPVPRESWDKLIEAILLQSGIGIKKVNSFTKQLFILKQDLSAVEAIVNEKESLYRFSEETRLAYIFSPTPERIKGVTQFFERFRDPKRTFIYQIGFKIAIIATKVEIEKLLTLYDAVWEQENEKVTKVFPIHKLTAGEMEKILGAYFSTSSRPGRIALMKGEGDDLTVLTLEHEGSLVLIGAKDMVEKAEKIIHQTEEQIQDPSEMTIYWYTCRHSDPVEVSEILEQVYSSLSMASDSEDGALKVLETALAHQQRLMEQHEENGAPSSPYVPPAYSPLAQPGLMLSATTQAQNEKSKTTHFIPYSKTGAIMMVVRRDSLEKIKTLLKKLDIPKKMVQIEVMVFEKQINSQSNSGINLLKLGSGASSESKTGFSFSGSGEKKSRGILDFFISRPKLNKYVPAFDIAYNFLMSQEDVRINAAPTVTTLNQTPAQISIVEEISINNGAVLGAEKLSSEKSYTRAAYGTTIVVTPTVHEPDLHLENPDRFVTLETKVNFDTQKGGDEDGRPNVNRRYVENQVRVRDGETIILGGLRKKTGDDKSEKIPFLGEIPGLGKLFGSSRMSDQFTEMFIFITPKIILDKQEDLERVRLEELKKRPGDLPEFMKSLEEAKKKKKRALFEQSMKLILE